MPDFAGTHLLCEGPGDAGAKAEIRRRLLTARRSAPAPLLAAADAALCAALAAEVAGASAQRSPAAGRVPTIAGYVPVGREPGGADLPRVLAEAVHPGRLLLPVLLPDLDLDWAEYTGTAGLRAAGRGLREPSGPRLGAGAIATIDLLVVPAVAVDRTGVRLGRGGGSYDRALARVPEGVEILTPLYAGELLERLPAEAHDRRVTTALVAEDTEVCRYRIKG